MNRSKLTIIAFAMALSPTNASAEALSEYATIGEWQILVDASVDNGCLMEKTFEDGTRMKMGALPNKKGGFLSVENKAWVQIKEVSTVVMQFDLDGTLFGGDVEYIIDGDWRGGYAFFNNPEFVGVLASKNAITITGPANQPVSYPLNGTSAALKALKKCQKENEG